MECYLKVFKHYNVKASDEFGDIRYKLLTIEFDGIIILSMEQVVRTSKNTKKMSIERP